MSISFNPSIRDFLTTNFLLHKFSEDIENPKYFLELLRLSKITKNNQTKKPININKEVYLNSKSEREKDKIILTKIIKKDYKQRTIVKKIVNQMPLLSPLPKIHFKRSFRYIYPKINYYKKKEPENNLNLAKDALIIRKYDEDNEQLLRSLSFIINKKNSDYKTNKKSRNDNNTKYNKEYTFNQNLSDNEENNGDNGDIIKSIDKYIDKGINKNISKSINKDIDGNIKYNENIKIKINDNNVSKSQHIKDININTINSNILTINKNDKQKLNLDMSKTKINLSSRNKINCKFIFKNESIKKDKESVEKYTDKRAEKDNSNSNGNINSNKDLLFNNINNFNNIKNENSLKMLDLEYKYDKNLESKIKPKNLIQTFQLKKYKIQNNNNINNNNINYYNNKILPSKIPNIYEIKEFLVKYKDKATVEKKYLSNKYIEYILLNKSTVNNTEKYYYKINKMYCKQLKEYMKHRINWIHVDTHIKNNNNIIINNELITINFQWKYYSTRLNFKEYKYEQNTPIRKLRMVNVFEKNAEIGNKKNMFVNLLLYCDKININTFDLVPLTIIVSNSKDIDSCLEALRDLMEFVEKKKLIGKDLITNKKYNELFFFDKNYENIKNQYIYINKNFLSEINYWIIKPTDLYQGKCIEITNDYEKLERKCKNLFRGVDRRIMPELVLNIEEEDSEEENIQINNTLNNNNNSGSENELLKSERNKNENNFNNNIEIINNDNNDNNDINIYSNNIINNFNTFSNNSSNKKTPKKKKNFSRMYLSNEIIIQKYLDNPLLYEKRKFDIRCYVLVDSNLNVYFCREGHLKSSSKFYDLNSDDKFIHITNHSIQKKCSKFAQYEYGNEMSYDDFKKVMKKDNIPLEKFDKMIEQMKYLIKISFKSVGNKLMKTIPVLCFEIFGYDFILDKDFKLWILEINNNPGLGISSPVILKLVPRMLDDAFRLTIDKVFETKYSNECIDENGKYKSKYHLDGFTDEENIFEFLCNVK